MQEAFLILAAAFALAILLVYMVMASQFEHFVHPFIIMFTVPLGIIGVIIGLLVTGRTLSLAVLVGVILLAGIAVNNGIVMIDYINQLIKRGVDKREAILQGATTRLRAVLLTALTTILGTLPMAFSRSSGSEFRAPLGVAIAFGLTATTFLTLFVIPVIYSVFNKIRFKEKNGPPLRPLALFRPCTSGRRRSRRSGRAWTAASICLTVPPRLRTVSMASSTMSWTMSVFLSSIGHLSSSR